MGTGEVRVVEAASSCHVGKVAEAVEAVWGLGGTETSGDNVPELSGGGDDVVHFISTDEEGSELLTGPPVSGDVSGESPILLIAASLE
jgi:hypothetical protein